MERWVGRVALVTGASVGIGAAICRQLVAAGMKVVGAARNAERIQGLAKQLSDKPGSLTAVRCDLTKDEDVLSLFSTIKQQFGRIDVCINNAGLSANHSLLEGTPDEWRNMLDVNVVALCLCTREAVALMKECKIDDGHIIHINSMSGHRVSNNPRGHFYSATKYAVTALTEGLRQELRQQKSHIRISAISPGLVETEFAQRMLQDEAQVKQLYSSIECLQADDIAESVMHVLSTPPHVEINEMYVRATEQAR